MQLLSETLLHQGRTQKDIKNKLRSSSKTSKISVHFSQTWVFCKDFTTRPQYQISR